MRNSSILILVAASLLLLSPDKSHSSSCCPTEGGGQKEEAHVSSGDLFLGLSYSYTLMEGYREGSETVSIGDIREETDYTIIPVDMTMERYTLTGGYRPTPRAAFSIAVPYIRYGMTMSLSRGPGLGWEESEMDPVTGLGDITLRASIIATSPERPGETLSFGAGIKTPTGDYRKKGSSGNYIHAHMQPGSGSWDPLVFVGYGKESEKYSWDASGSIQWATRNPEGYRAGSIASASLNGGYLVSDRVSLGGGLTFRLNGKASDEDGKYTNPASLIDDTANTGGESLWGAVGAGLKPSENTNFSLRYLFPLWQRVAGIQMVSKYAVMAAFSANF